ncbi:3'-5' exonuclease [Caenimonas koreensis]|uniref:3'-5' exonuclease n=1 Tax=Caenimonas koreensis TaxID=367474 RepID=UPI003784432C
MTSGERRLAERLEDKLDPDYLVWYDVPIGPKHLHPDFVVLHPRRGLLILEAKDWKRDTLRSANKEVCEILVHGQPKTVPNPLVQARHYAHQIVDALKRDAQLVNHEGRHQGALAFPWSYGVVLTQITRKQFTEAELDQVIEPHRVVCSDEMTATVDAEDFQSRLWDMFPYMMRGVLSLPQIDRVRWTMFPEIRVGAQPQLFGEEGEGGAGADADLPVPDMIRVMDLQQEQLARSLGDGHRVIHGVAGSGKTMILGYRAEYLARAATKPILVLCYNEPLAAQLAANMASKGLKDKVHVRHFHKWCRDQLVAFGQSLPHSELSGQAFYADLVDRVIRGVDRGQIPAAQYFAVMIDEGHDFAPEWLKLVVQMVEPETNSLLVLYDDAQSIYERTKKRKFSFKSVGIQAVGRGRSTILRINYRNTRQVLQLASRIAGDLLSPEDADEDGIPLLQPMSCGREGASPVIVKLPSIKAEADRIADLLSQAHDEGHAWGDMAVLFHSGWVGTECADAFTRRKLPFQLRGKPGTFEPGANAIKIMSMHASKGLEFPVVALPGVGRMPRPSLDKAEEARLFYVAATRATHKLLITVSGEGEFADRLLAMAD